RRHAVAIAPTRRKHLVARAAASADPRRRRRARALRGHPTRRGVPLHAHRAWGGDGRRPRAERSGDHAAYVGRLELTGSYVPSRNGAAIIVGPGYASTQEAARMLIRHGYGVLLFDQRGEGRSDGDPNALGWSAETDVNAAIAFLETRPDVHRGRIGGLGLSVGGESLLQTAAHNT